MTPATEREQAPAGEPLTLREWLTVPPRRFDPGAPPRRRRPLRLPEPDICLFRTADDVELRLTRYQGGGRGPVLLSHCIGVSSRMYLADTQPTTLTEFLCERGYDVWLLDYRFSIELRASRMQSTMDEVATLDYPAAVAEVRRRTNAESVQVVAHGVGSSTFTMAMLAGLEGVRAAVCSQVSTHLFVPLLNRLKTETRSSSLMGALGVQTATAYSDARGAWPSRLFDRALRLYPVAPGERCRSPVCHRISMIYGELYEHDRLGAATHEALHELFGVVNTSALRQLSRITRRNHLVNARGEEAYLPHLDRLAIPIAFLHGSDNQCVLPRSTEVTYDLLSRRHGEHLYRRHVIPGYGHVDCMLGEHADRDVFPAIVEHLERTA